MPFVDNLFSDPRSSAFIRGQTSSDLAAADGLGVAGGVGDFAELEAEIARALDRLVAERGGR